MPKNSRNAPKRQTRIFYRNLQCFEPSQGRCEQSLYRAQGHFCWYLRCFLRFLAAHNGPFLGQNGPANLKFGTAPPPRPPPPQTIYANNSQRYCAFRHQIRRPHTQVHVYAICPSTRHLHIANCSKICAIPELHRHNNPDAAAEVVRVDGLAAKTCHVLVPPTCTIPPFATREFVSISPWRAIPPDPYIHFGAFLGHRRLKHKHLSRLPTSAAMLAEGIQQQSWNVVKDRASGLCENCQASNGHPMYALKNREGDCPSADQSNRRQNMRCFGRIHAFPRQMGASAHGYWNSGALLDVPDHIAQQHRYEFVPEATLKI